MKYVQRDSTTNKVIGCFANKQSYATELLPDDHPDIMEFQNLKAQRNPTLQEQITALETRVADLEARIII